MLKRRSGEVRGKRETPERACSDKKYVDHVQCVIWQASRCAHDLVGANDESGCVGSSQSIVLRGHNFSPALRIRHCEGGG